MNENLNSDSDSKLRPASSILQRIFSRYSKKTLLTDARTAKQYSYKDVDELSGNLASYLLINLKLKELDRVVLLIDNRIESVVLYLACLKARITSIPINPEFKDYELNKILSSCQTNLIITYTEFYEKVAICSEHNNLKLFVFDKELKIEDLNLMGKLSEPSYSKNQDSDLAHIVYSSGTTDKPKAIPIKFGKIIKHAEMFVAYQGIKDTAVFFNTLPLAYLGGWYNLVLVPMIAGASVVIEKTFGPQTMYAFWANIVKYSVNSIWLTPTILSTLLSIGIDDEEIQSYVKTKIIWSMSGMAPLNPELKLKFENYFGLQLLQSYGLSETFLFTSSRYKDKSPYETVGKVMPGYTVEIDHQNSAGEIIVSGDFIFDGYLDKHDGNNLSLNDGKLRTGDLGMLDQDGNLFLTGRSKDIIIKAGLNISPFEIESVILKLDEVIEVCVLGNPDSVLGEQIVAVIVKESSVTDLDSKKVKDHCRKILSKSKVPDVVIFSDELPKNPSGKLLRRELTKLLKLEK